MRFFDTETCGLHGPIVLFQYADGLDGKINLVNIWHQKIIDLLKLFEETAEQDVCGFNLAFDWFHVQQMYSVLLLMDDINATLEDCVQEYVEKEPLGRDGPCIKPRRACDLMLWARKGKYQSMMNRKPIRIRKIPTTIAYQLAQELDKAIEFNPIFFSRKKASDKEYWKIQDVINNEGKINPNFKDIELKFYASTALKVLAMDALNLDRGQILMFKDVELPKSAFPEEKGYAPFAKAAGHYAWPLYLRQHISHWAYNSLAREYGADDVKYLQKLYPFFGSPEPGDDDSELACMVGSCRWRGYGIDIEKMKKAKIDAEAIVAKTPMAPRTVKIWLSQVMSPAEQAIIKRSTKKTILMEVAKMEADCPECGGIEGGCLRCNFTGGIKHPAADRAQQVLDARTSKKMIEVYEKLLEAGRFHASFVVIGTKSSRMSGTDDLNAQGISHNKDVRKLFTLVQGNQELVAGDFESFEVCLAEASYNDPNLRKDLLSGVKIHGVLGAELNPPMTYEQVLATKGQVPDHYDEGKRSVFALIYGGDHNTIKIKVGIALEIAEIAVAKFMKRYPKVYEARKKVFDMFCSMRQPNGIGTKVEWHEPSEYVETPLGFKRYFTLENTVCKALFKMAQTLPVSLQGIKARVIRPQARQELERPQTISGAIQSSLYGAAFQIQAANMRAAANHMIQSFGASLTKNLQRRVWDLQPSGVHSWQVQPMNIHDEILVPCNPVLKTSIKSIVDTFVEEYKALVPLLGIDWKNEMKTWADK